MPNKWAEANRDLPYEIFWTLFKCLPSGGHHWRRGSQLSTTDRPGTERFETYCTGCSKPGPDVYLTEAEWRQEQREASAAYQKGSPYIEVIRQSLLTGQWELSLDPNADYDRNWKPRTAAEDEAANYIARGAIGNPPILA